MNRRPAIENLLDKQIGSLLRAHRRAVGMGQDELAAAVGVTFQQIQKYETGENRISASKLVEVASAIGVPIMALLEGTDRFHENAASGAANLLSKFGCLPEAPEFMRAALTLPPQLRAQVFALAIELASPAN